MGPRNVKKQYYDQPKIPTSAISQKQERLAQQDDITAANLNDITISFTKDRCATLVTTGVIIPQFHVVGIATTDHLCHWTFRIDAAKTRFQRVHIEPAIELTWDGDKAVRDWPLNSSKGRSLRKRL